MKITKLNSYKQAMSDLGTIKTVVEGFGDIIREIGSIEISSSLTIMKNSSDKQYIYAISVLNGQIKACKELGIDPEEYVKTRKTVITLRDTVKDFSEWQKFGTELMHYAAEVENLLSNEEKFSLLEYPVKK
jgi:hypothetical protein